MRLIRIRLLLFILLSVSIACAQSVAQNPERIKQLTKDNASLIKQLKSDYKLKKVTIELEDEQQWHFILTNKDDRVGVANKNGNIIISPRFNKLLYVPELTAGYSTFKAPKDAVTDLTVYHPARIAHFEGRSFYFKNQYDSERNRCEVGLEKILHHGYVRKSVM